MKIKKAKTKLVENKIIKPPLKICSNKPTFVKWIVSHFPDNYQDLIYVDPYCGGLNILALKEKSFIEVVNDLDNSLVEIYKSLRSEPKEFVKRLGRHSFCEETFNKAQKKTHIKSDYLDDSINEYIVRKMSKMELKRSFCKTNLSSWNDSLKCLFNFASRIQETFIFNNKAIEIIKTFNFENTLLYCDPPHLHETKKGKTVYSSEMSIEDHIKLAHSLNSFKGKVIISGIMSPLYKRLYKNWEIHRSKIKKTGDKTQIIWKNFK